MLRDIEKMITDLEINDPKLGGVYIDAKGEQRPCFNLPKDLTFTLVLGYDVKRRYAVTRRWLELEEGRALTKTPPRGRGGVLGFRIRLFLSLAYGFKVQGVAH